MRHPHIHLAPNEPWEKYRRRDIQRLPIKPRLIKAMRPRRTQNERKTQANAACQPVWKQTQIKSRNPSCLNDMFDLYRYCRTDTHVCSADTFRKHVYRLRIYMLTTIIAFISSTQLLIVGHIYHRAFKILFVCSVKSFSPRTYSRTSRF